MTPPAGAKTRMRAAPGLGRTLLLQSLARSGPATAKALAADLGLGTEEVYPAGRRLSWAAADEAGGREISWEHDPASGQWTLAFRILRDGQRVAVREVLVPDISVLAWQVREIAGTRNPEAAVVWMPGDAVEGSFWAVPQAAGPCAPELAGFRARFAAG